MAIDRAWAQAEPVGNRFGRDPFACGPHDLALAPGEEGARGRVLLERVADCADSARTETMPAPHALQGGEDLVERFTLEDAAAHAGAIHLPQDGGGGDSAEEKHFDLIWKPESQKEEGMKQEYGGARIAEGEAGTQEKTGLIWKPGSQE